LIGYFASQILYAWIYDSSDGSVWIVILTHATQNAIGGEFFSPMFSGTDSERIALLLGSVYCAAAALVIAAAGPKSLAYGHPEQEEPPVTMQRPPETDVRVGNR
jgi:hypothetical protein